MRGVGGIFKRNRLLVVVSSYNPGLFGKIVRTCVNRAHGTQFWRMHGALEEFLRRGAEIAD